MFSTVMGSIDADPEFWIRMLKSGNSKIQVMLYQEDDQELDDELLTANEQLTHSSFNSGSFSWSNMTCILEFLGVTSLIHISVSASVLIITVENMSSNTT